MRFRAKVVLPLALSRVASCAERVTKVLVMIITPSNFVHFLNVNESNGILFRAKIPTNTVFEDFLVESKADNHICCDLVVEHLQRALKNAERADDISIRLSKRDKMPFLTLVVQGAVNLTQDIPIHILSVRDFMPMVHLNMQAPEVRLLAPKARSFGVVVDRMRGLSTVVRVHGSMQGELHLEARSDNETASTKFQNVGFPSSANDDQEDIDVNAEAAVVVDNRAFSKALYSLSLNPSFSVCCISHDQLLLWFTNIMGAEITYAIPGIME